MPSTARRTPRAVAFSPNGNGISEEIFPTAGDAVDAFIRHIARNDARPTTQRHYETALRHDLRDLAWPLTAPAMEDWRDDQLGRGPRRNGLKPYTASTQYSRWTIMSQFCRWLVNKGALDADPIAQALMKPPERAKANPTERTATDDELAKLLRACHVENWWDHRLYVMIKLLRNTALRVGEACKLRWSDIQWNEPVLGEARIRLKGTKASKGDEIEYAHLTEPAFTVLRDWQKRLVRDGRGGDTQWVFPVADGGGFMKKERRIPVSQPRQTPRQYRDDHIDTDGKLVEAHWTPHQVWQMFYALSVRARLTRSIYPHMLRHTAATEFAVKTDDLESTRNFLRHADYRMVKAYLDPKKTWERMAAQHRKVTLGKEG